MRIFQPGDRVRIVGVARGIGGSSLVGQCGTVHEQVRLDHGIGYSVRVGNWDGSMTWCNLDDEDIEHVSAAEEYSHPLLLLTFVTGLSGLLWAFERDRPVGVAAGVAAAGFSVVAMWAFGIWQVRRASIR
jgi:hypothetical protein